MRLPSHLTPEAGEIWRRLPHYNAWVSTLGRVASRRRVLTPRPSPNKLGHHHVGLPTKPVTRKSVPMLVLEAFTTVRPPGHDATFLNDDRMDWRLENLRWRKKAGNAHNHPPRPYVPKPRKPRKSRAGAGRTPYPPMGEQLRRALSFNEVWAAAERVTPRGLPHHSREDIISDLVVAYLAGEMAVEQFPQGLDAIRKAHNRLFDGRNTVSIDAALHGHANLTLAGIISQEQSTQFWEGVAA